MVSSARRSLLGVLATVLAVTPTHAWGAPGELDPTFGSNGIATVDFAAFYDYASGLALQPDGKLVLAGQAWNGSKYDFGVARLLPDGTPTPDNGVAYGEEPVDGVLTLGGQPQAAVGLCGETSFIPADCFWNSGRDQLTCKK